MNRILAIITLAASIAACNKMPEVSRSQMEQQIINNIIPTKEISVTPTSDVAVVSVNGVPVAALTEKSTIAVAKSANPVVEQLTQAQFDQKYAGELTANAAHDWQVIAFEDSHNGDYDYNDLVIHVKYQRKGQIFRIGVHPIALGSTKIIKLGYDIYQNGKFIATDQMVTPTDCRTDLFKNKVGMLNTSGDIAFVCNELVWKSELYTVNSYQPTYIRWFIDVDNSRFYAISTAYTTTMLNADQHPYGIVSAATGYTYTQEGQGEVGSDWFNYPLETYNIESVYPQFGKWLSGTYTGSFKDMYDPTNSDSYDPAGKGLYVVPKGKTEIL